MSLPTATDDGRFAVLLNGHRVEKDDPRIEACGEVDELNSAIGLALAHLQDQQARAELQTIQTELFLVGSLLADPVNIALEFPKIIALEFPNFIGGKFPRHMFGCCQGAAAA